MSLIVRGVDVVEPRIPATPTSPPGMPSTCSDNLSAQVSAWRNEDICDWDALSNHFCSHQMGWVEKVPGTCKAGGPPPICTADHWVRRGDSLSIIKNEQRKLKSEREAKLKEMRKQACSCWEKSIGSDEPLPTPQVGQPSSFASCGFGGCPPGYSCKSGSCYLDSGPKTAAKAAVGMGASFARDATLEEILKAFEASSLAISGLLNYAMPMLSSASMNNSLEGYYKRLGDYESRLQQMQALSKELGDAVSGRPSRGAAQIRADLSRLKPAIVESFERLASLAKDVIMEQQISPEQCPNIFAARHRRFEGLHAMVLAQLDLAQ